MSNTKLEEFKQLCENSLLDADAQFDDFLTEHSEHCAQWRKAYMLDDRITSRFHELYSSVGYNVLYGTDVSHVRRLLDEYGTDYVNSKPPDGFVYVYVNSY